MKIAHLSDLHLNTFFKDSNLVKIKQLLRHAIEEGFDHMVITGDLTDNADSEDFQILRELFKSYGLLDPEKLSLIPGNHDIFGGLQTAEDILVFPEKCRTTDYQQKVREFEGYFPEVFENCVYKGKDNMFPFAKIVNDVLFVGLNSNAKYSKIKNPFASNGEIELNQFYEAENILSNFGPAVKTKIILAHHHFNKMYTNGDNSALSLWQNIEKQTMKLRKKKRLIKLFNNHKVDLVLHGHLHETAEYERKGLKFLNGGGCIKSSSKNSLSMNFIDVHAEGIKIATHKIYISKEADAVRGLISESEFSKYQVLPSPSIMN